jgi:hypothetical protein
VGLTRGPVPNLERMLQQAQSQAQSQGQQLARTREQLSQTSQQFAQAREQLSEKNQQLAQVQEQLSERSRQFAQVREQLSQTSQQFAQAREQLSEKNQQLAALQANIDIALGPAEERYDSELYRDIAAILDRIPIDLGGGCSLTKAYMLAWLIRQYDLKETVDIGVYRGRSLFPQALAHRRFTGGVVYGVDPWSASEAKESDMYMNFDEEEKEGIDNFIDRTDWESIYREVESMRKEFHHEEHCILRRQTSAAAAAYFQENETFFDMVHVDGNHDTEKVMEDIELYLPRLRDSGIIILDDVSFESVRPAYDQLNAETTLVFERVDHNQANDYAVFWNDPSLRGARRSRRLWVQHFWLGIREKERESETRNS